MADLISTATAKLHIRQTTYSSDDDTIIANGISAASKYIQMRTGREFVRTTFDQLYSGNGNQELFLRQIPLVVPASGILSPITRVASNPEEVIGIKNTSWPTNTRATIHVTALDVTLSRVASATTTTSNVAWSSYTTLAAVVTQINTLSSGGWSARLVDSNYGTWASADLRAPQTALSVVNSQEAYLKLHTEELTDYETDDGAGILIHPYGWPRGYQNIRVVYTAGFATVPEDVQQACAIYTAAYFKQTKRDPGLAMERTADYTYQAYPLFEQTGVENAMRMFRQYTIHRIISR